MRGHELPDERIVGVLVHALWPRRDSAQGAIGSGLACDAAIEPADPVDVAVLARRVLQGIAEAVRLAREKALAAARQVEPAGAGARLRAEEEPAPAAERDARKPGQGDGLIDRAAVSQGEADLHGGARIVPEIGLETLLRPADFFLALSSLLLPLCFP